MAFSCPANLDSYLWTYETCAASNTNNQPATTRLNDAYKPNTDGQIYLIHLTKIFIAARDRHISV